MASVLPSEIREMMAQCPERRHHYLCHQIRNSWRSYPEETRLRLTELARSGAAV